jgi:tRNA-dihydrouridine synthase A
MHKFAVAPMMNLTTKHCRYFYRLLSTKAQLWTEMITVKAIINGDKNYLLDFNDCENPLVLQVGGNEPKEMVEAAKIAKKFGYNEININVGCPSNKVKSGNFGACLMLKPNIVAACVKEIKDKVDIKVSVKSRIGVDDLEDYQNLANFVEIIKNSGCNDFIFHARKAWLKGLSPKQNRTLPPLNYDFVYQIKKDFSNLNIVINGGIKDIKESTKHLKHVDGVMLGRAIYNQPYLLADVDNSIYKKNLITISREKVLLKFIKYIQIELKKGQKINSMTRHILGLYHGRKNSKNFKQMLNNKDLKLENIYKWLELKS